MTKNEALKELKGMFNSVKLVNRTKIRRRCWDKNTWQVVDSLDFNTANTIKDFYYQQDLAEYLSKNN